MARKKQNGSVVYLKLPRPFVGLPVETIMDKRLNGLKVHSRWLYVVLLTRFSRDKTKLKRPFAFTYEELGDITGYRAERIAACIKELETADFIVVEHGGKHNPSTYKPVLDWLG